MQPRGPYPHHILLHDLQVTGVYRFQPPCRSDIFSAALDVFFRGIHSTQVLHVSFFHFLHPQQPCKHHDIDSHYPKELFLTNIL